VSNYDRFEASGHICRAAGVIGTWGLWALIGALFLWAALDERQLFVIGLIVGSVLALGAIGLTLIYGILRFGNFAHGDTMMLGAYVAFFFLTGLVKEERRDTSIGVGWEICRARRTGWETSPLGTGSCSPPRELQSFS
jgi:hypothetical protein